MTRSRYSDRVRGNKVMPELAPNPKGAGASAGSPGTLPTYWSDSLPGLVRQSVSQPSPGVTRVRYTGTASASGGFLFQFNALASAIPVVAGKQYDVSAVVVLGAGASGVVTAIRTQWVNSANGNLSLNDIVLPVQSGRITAPAQAVKALFGLRLGLTSGQVYDITFDIGALSFKQVQ